MSQEVAQMFADSATSDPELFGILFTMNIDTNVSSAPFARLDNVSCYRDVEQEILFSTHSIFRIDDIIQQSSDDRLWEVTLMLTNDVDSWHRALIEAIREQISEVPIGWYRLGQLLIKLGHFKKAEEVFHALLREQSDELDQATFYHQLGYVKYEQKSFDDAIFFYGKSFDIRQRSLSQNNPLLATSYNSIAVLYGNMGEYSEALLFYDRALAIDQNCPFRKRSTLSTYYNNIGSIYENIKQYAEALEYQNKSLVIGKQTLPSYHPSLAISHKSIASICKSNNFLWKVY